MIINNYVMHILEKGTNEPNLSEVEGYITAELDKYLQKVIKKAKKDDSMRKAKFTNYDENIVKKCCDNILYGEGFLENSKEIAHHLFEIMSCSGDIESGVLLVSTVTEKEDTFVVLLKMDYKSVYTQNISFEDDKFNVQVGVTNSISDRVKQGAIIGLNGVNDDFHLRVLDKDAEKEGIDGAFTKSFLEVEKVVDDTYKTKQFMDRVNTWITNSLSDDIRKAEDVRSLIAYTLKEKDELDVDKLIAKIDLDEELADSLKEHLEDAEVTNKFEINKEVVEKKLKKRTVKMSNGFKINGDLSDFEDPMKYSIRKNENGSTDIVIKNVTFIEG